MVNWVLKGERAHPFEAQAIATEKAFGRRGWGHFLEMGIGKTSVALNEFLVAHRKLDFEKHIVLSPNKFKKGWQTEATLCEYPVPFHVMDSDKRKDALAFLNDNPVCTLVVNHESIIFPKTLEILQKLVGPATMLTIDESIAFKNPKAKSSLTALALAKECGIVRDLSGKPITQGPHDLWMQLRLVGALEKFNYFAFKNTFCKIGGFMNKQVLGAKNEERLHQILDEWCWFARKVDYTDLPERQWLPPIRISMSDRQRMLYEAMEENFIVWLQESGDEVVADMVITRNMKLDQIASGFIMDGDRVNERLMSVENNPRIQAVHDLMENRINGKLIISAFYKESIEMLTEAMARYNPAFILSESLMKARGLDIEREKYKFNNDPTCRMCIGATKPLKYGHTLLGDQAIPDNACYTLLFYENTYSLDDREQVEARNHRNGQRYPVSYVDFAVSDMDDAKIRALQRKEDVASSVMRYARETGTLPPRPSLD